MRYIEANWSKKWSTDEMKELIWLYSWTICNEEFKNMLGQLGEVSDDSVRDLLKHPLVSWC